jgi:hypothetical protein
MSTLRDDIAMAICMASCGMAAHRSDYMADADAALSAFRAWLEAEGLVVVPREATQDMTGAVLDACAPRLKIMKTYAAMIAASPDFFNLETKP